MAAPTLTLTLQGEAAAMAAMATMASALGLTIVPISSGKAAAPVKAASVRYFTDEEIAEGGGYPCTHKAPCSAMLKGPNRTAAHSGKHGHRVVK